MNSHFLLFYPYNQSCDKLYPGASKGPLDLQSTYRVDSVSFNDSFSGLVAQWWHRYLLFLRALFDLNFVFCKTPKATDPPIIARKVRRPYFVHI